MTNTQNSKDYNVIITVLVHNSPSQSVDRMHPMFDIKLLG